MASLLSFVSSSCLRAFVPSCEKPKASQGQPASRFFTNLIFSWAKGAKGGFAPCVLFATKRWSDFLTQLSGLTFLFLHEGTKARRHEGKKSEKLERGDLSNLVPKLYLGTHGPAKFHFASVSPVLFFSSFPNSIWEWEANGTTPTGGGAVCDHQERPLKMGERKQHRSFATIAAVAVLLVLVAGLGFLCWVHFIFTGNPYVRGNPNAVGLPPVLVGKQILDNASPLSGLQPSGYTCQVWNLNGTEERIAEECAPAHVIREKAIWFSREGASEEEQRRLTRIIHESQSKNTAPAQMELEKMLTDKSMKYCYDNFYELPSAPSGGNFAAGIWLCSPKNKTLMFINIIEN